MINLGIINDGVKIGKNSLTINQQVRDNVHRFKNCDFDISQLSTQLANECVKVGRNNIYEEDNFKLGYTSHLISRANLFFNNEAMCSALGINNQGRQPEDIVTGKQIGRAHV